MSTLRIRLDPGIPESMGVFDDLGTVQPLDAAEVARNPRAVADAQILIVRSVTRIDERLLEALPHLLVVVTPVVGLDHVDFGAVEAFQRRHGRPLPVLHAPGATADGVGDWVIAALATSGAWADGGGRGVSVGILGFGHCGQAVAWRLDRLGVPWVACDPPRQDAGDPGPWVGYEALADCDIVTVHVPLTTAGAVRWPTFNLLDVRFLDRLARGRCRFLVNSSRGDVLDEQAVLRFDAGGPSLPGLVLDVFQGEPRPSPDIVAAAAFATPHVAGNVVEGRRRALQRVRADLLRFLGLSLTGTRRDEAAPEGAMASSPTSRAGNDLASWVLSTGLSSCAAAFRMEYLAATYESRPQVFRRIRAAAMRHEGAWGRPSPAGESLPGRAGAV